MLQAVACGFKWLFTGLALSRLISVISFTKKLLKPLFNDLFNIVVGDAGGLFMPIKRVLVSLLLPFLVLVIYEFKTGQQNYWVAISMWVVYSAFTWIPEFLKWYKKE